MDESEKLFWKIWRNIVLNNIIFDFLTEEPIEFTNILEFHFCNRIKFKYIKSLKWMVKRNQWALLKDKLISNTPITYKNINSAINLLVEKCKDNENASTILETFYLNNRTSNFGKLNPLKLSIINNNLIGVTVFSDYFQITETLIEKSLQHFVEKQILQNEIENKKKMEIIDFLINKFNYDNQSTGENNFKLPFESIDYYSKYQPLVNILFNLNCFKVEKLEVIIKFLIEKINNDKLYIPSNIIFKIIKLNYSREEITHSVSNKPNFIIKLFKNRLFNNNNNNNNINNNFDNNILKNQFISFFDELLLIPKKSFSLLFNNKEEKKEQFNLENQLAKKEKYPLQHFINDTSIDKLTIKQLFEYGEVQLAIEKSKRKGPQSFYHLLSTKQFSQLIKYFDYELIVEYISLYLSVNIRQEYLVNRFDRCMKLAKRAQRSDIIDYLSNLKTFNNKSLIAI
ncbi:hypothetical protein ACTFIV_000694 [Dictyostelium citrinum]